MTPPDPFTYGPGALYGADGREVAGVRDFSLVLEPVSMARGIAAPLRGRVEVSGTFTVDMPEIPGWLADLFRDRAPHGWPSRSYRGRALTVWIRGGVPGGRAEREHTGAPLASPRPGGVRRRVERREVEALLGIAASLYQALQPEEVQVSTRSVPGLYRSRSAFVGVSVRDRGQVHDLHVTADYMAHHGMRRLVEGFERRMAAQRSSVIPSELPAWPPRHV